MNRKERRSLLKQAYTREQRRLHRELRRAYLVGDRYTAQLIAKQLGWDQYNG